MRRVTGEVGGRVRRLRGAAALAALMGVGMLGADGAAAEAVEDGAADAGEIVVTATRTEKDPFQVPVVTTLITDEEIEENLVTDIKDLIRFEPGISVPTSPSRFGAALAATGRDGNSGFNIRGMGGNRVLFQVDGVRLADGFSFGPNAFGRGDYVDLDLVSSVEIVRGPASALYGSDGLAGVVSFITRDPNDFLQSDENFRARARVSYASVDESWSENLTGAWRLSDQWSVLGAYTRRDGRETDNQGVVGLPDSRRTEPNPQDWESNAALARLVFEPSDMHRFRLTGEYGDRYIATEALSGRAILPLGPAPGSNSSVIDLDGEDESERSRVALDYTFSNEGGFIDNAFIAIYSQSSWARQFSAENRNVSADRTRETTYDNDVWGISAQGESSFEGSIQNRFVYGIDHSVTTSGAIRGGTVPTPPAVFPERPFPETEFTRTGAFLVDEITVLDGALTFFPGVRYDAYEITPNRDTLYVWPLFEQDGTHLSPKFGIVAWPTDHFGAYFNYAEGFKSPAPSEVNNFVENLTLAPTNAYTSIPNTNLGPETSTGVEAGIRGRDWAMFNGTWNWTLGGFSTWYEDFISQQIVGGNGSALTPFLYQFVNLNEVQISGVEARVDAAWQSGVGLNLAMAWAEGDQTVSGVTSALQSTDPFTLVAGLTYADQEGRFGGQLALTWVVEKEANEVTAGTFNPDGFTVWDMTGYVNLSDAATLRVGVFNLTDETYWLWSDVRGLSAASTTLDAYTRPGRNVSASISYRF